MKVKKKVIKTVQGILKEIAVETVGRSIPWGLYEKQINEKLFNEIEKVRKNAH